MPFDVGHSTLPSVADLDPSTLRSALVALVQSSVLLFLLSCCQLDVAGSQLRSIYLGYSWPATAVTAAHAAALRGYSCGGSSAIPAALATPVGAFSSLLQRALFLAASAVLFLLLLRALLSAASTGALSRLHLRILLRWLLLRVTASLLLLCFS